MATTSIGGWQLFIVVATATLFSIVCSNVAAAAAATQTSSTAEGQAREIHGSGAAHKNIAHVYANHGGREQQQQQQQQQQQRQLQQHYYDFHYKPNSSSGNSNHNGIFTPTATKSAAAIAKAAAAEKEEEAAKHAARRSYSSRISISSGGSGGSGGGGGGGGGSSTDSSSEWRSTSHSAANGGFGSGDNSRSYNFEIAKLNGLTNLSRLRHITSGFGGSSWNSAAAAASAAEHSTSDDSATATLAKATIARTKNHIPIYEDQQENDYGASTLGHSVGSSASGAAGQTFGENNQHSSSSSSSTYSGGSGSSGGGASAWGSYNSASSSGNDALTTALYNLHTAGTHNGFLPLSSSSSAYGGKYSTGGITPQPTDKISDGSFLHRYEHNSGAYDELSAAATYEQQQQHEAPISSSGLSYYAPHDSYVSSHSDPDSGSATDINVSIGGHHGGVGGAGDDVVEAGVGGPHSYDDSNNYLPEQHQSSDDVHSPPPDVINYIPYPVVKKVHVPVRENVQIPISHAIIVPVSKPVPIHIPITKHVPVPVEKELRVPVERVVPYPVEKPVAVPVEKRVPFEVVKYVTVKVPHPFPVKVPVFKTILHKVHKVQKGGWW